MNIKVTKEKLPDFEREFRIQLKKQFPEIDLQDVKLEYDNAREEIAVFKTKGTARIHKQDIVTLATTLSMGITS
jgi:hypothetical protein